MTLPERSLGKCPDELVGDNLPLSELLPSGELLGARAQGRHYSSQ